MSGIAPLDSQVHGVARNEPGRRLGDAGGVVEGAGEGKRPSVGVERVVSVVQLLIPVVVLSVVVPVPLADVNVERRRSMMLYTVVVAVPGALLKDVVQRGREEHEEVGDPGGAGAGEMVGHAGG